MPRVDLARMGSRVLIRVSKAVVEIHKSLAGIGDVVRILQRHGVVTDGLGRG